MAALLISNIDRTDSRGEFVEIVNEGLSPALLTGLRLVGPRLDIFPTTMFAFRFPSLAIGVPLELVGGHSAFIFTRGGASPTNDEGDWLLFAGYAGSAWGEGGRAKLLGIDGRVLDRYSVSGRWQASHGMSR